MVPKILLVDDDSDDRELFCEALEALDQQSICYTAPNAHKALSQMDKKEIEKPDLIFLDINLPIMKGLECLSILKEHEEYKSIPVIMFSTSSYPTEIDMARQLGALCFFSKPSAFKDLKNSLEKVITYLMNGSLWSLTINSRVFIISSQ